MEPAKKAGMDFAGGGVELYFIVQHQRTDARWTKHHKELSESERSLGSGSNPVHPGNLHSRSPLSSVFS